ncbi:MAG: hypothetical protein R3D62_15880 [Xanthobacteraceae bacterium]
MKALAIILGVVLALGVAFVWAFPTYSHRYRLTVEVDTPEGVRSASSVIEVVRKDERWVLIAQGAYVYRVHGEAVFVDLGGGRNVIALLAHGPNGTNVDQMISLGIEAYGHFKWDQDAWTGRTKMQGPVTLKAPLIPTFVTFSDLSDPKTARVVPPDAFEKVFGPGVHLRSVTLEMVPSGTWPFTWLGWPRSLAGVPVTRGIEAKLPMLKTHRDWMRRINSRPNQFTPQYHLFKRS